MSRVDKRYRQWIAILICAVVYSYHKFFYFRYSYPFFAQIIMYQTQLCCGILPWYLWCTALCHVIHFSIASKRFAFFGFVYLIPVGVSLCQFSASCWCFFFFLFICYCQLVFSSVLVVHVPQFRKLIAFKIWLLFILVNLLITTYSKLSYNQSVLLVLLFMNYCCIVELFITLHVSLINLSI